MIGMKVHDGGRCVCVFCCCQVFISWNLTMTGWWGGGALDQQHSFLTSEASAAASIWLSKRQMNLQWRITSQISNRSSIVGSIFFGNGCCGWLRRVQKNLNCF